jgi:hypothetical protein
MYQKRGHLQFWYNMLLLTSDEQTKTKTKTMVVLVLFLQTYSWSWSCTSSLGLAARLLHYLKFKDNNYIQKSVDDQPRSCRGAGRLQTGCRSNSCR